MQAKKKGRHIMYKYRDKKDGNTYVVANANEAARHFPTNKATIARIKKLQNSGAEPFMDDDSPELSDKKEGLISSITRRLRGRPKKAFPMKRIDLMLEVEDIGYLRGTGRGWQTRLREYIKQGIKSQLI